MFYYFFDWLAKQKTFSGSGLVQYISFRAMLATLFSLSILLVFGNRFIAYLQRKQICETVRELGLQGEQKKAKAVSMGGILLVITIVVSTLLFAKIHNVYILLMLFTTLGFGLIGFVDDYIKVFDKNKAGLRGRTKIIGQILCSFVLAVVLYFNENVTVYREVIPTNDTKVSLSTKGQEYDGIDRKFIPVKSTVTTIPFIKTHEFNYAKVLGIISEKLEKYTFIVYLFAVTFIMVAVSNGANLTDGLDGLAAGVSVICATCLGVFAYISGNFDLANYFHILFLPNIGELSIFIGSFIGAFVGFLWFNTYPARIFMGDTGSLTAGGIIAALSFIIRKELMIPIFCGIFLIENISVVMQVVYFKYTRRKYGQGRRILLMAPLHHHFQKRGGR